MMIMKRIYFTIALLSLVFSGCVGENIQNEIADGTPAENMVPVSFVTLAPSAVADESTRTMLNADNSVSWHSDDAVAYLTFDDPIKFTNAFSDGPVGVFTGQLPNTSFKNDSEAFLVYPYREPQEGIAAPKKSMTNYIDGTYVIENIVIPPRQELLSGTFDKRSNLSAAVIDWNDEKPIQFQNLNMLICLKLKGNAAIKRIRIDGSYTLAGTFQLNYLGDTAEPGKKFKLSDANEVHGNPPKSTAVILESKSEEGVQLTEIPQSFYIAAYVATTQRMSVQIYVTTVEGHFFKLTDKNGSYYLYTKDNVAPSRISSIGEFTINGPLFYENEISCDKNEHEIEANKTRYLNDDYEISTDDASTWFTATKTANGIKINVEKNTTGKSRTGTVTVKRGDEILTTLSVNQQKFGYGDLLGKYMLYNHASSSSTGTWILNFKENESGQEDHYIVEITKMISFNTDNYHPTFTVKYNAVGKTPLSLILPQTLDDYNGQKVRLYAMTLNGILCTDEGIGFDIRSTANDCAEGFYFEPNNFTNGSYRKAIILSLILNDNNVDQIQLQNDERYPDLIPIDVVGLDGIHQGITPIN